MLVARRNSFHPDAHDAGYHRADGMTERPRLARTVSMLQVVGSLLAIPVGLASAYSIYRVNFSPDTACQTLRAGIVSMLDRNVDAATRRILVRRDVETFEKTCGAVDPDATAAFKNLLVAAPTSATAVAPAAAQPAAAPAKQAVRRIEPHVQAAKALPDVEAPRHDHAVSDQQWVDAVRQALVTDEHAPAPPPVAKQAMAPNSVMAPVMAPAAPTSIAPPLASVPVASMPPAAMPATAPAPQVDAGHPVPPAAIPDPSAAAAAAPAAPHSRIGRWIARVPLLGPVWENGQQ